MIKIAREVLGEVKEDAVVKTFYFSTNFNGGCEVTVTDYPSEQARISSLSNGINKTVVIEETEESKKIISEINEKVYLLLHLQEEFEGGVKC